MDRNGDGLYDTSIAYRLGRPVLAEIDPNQDGITDYSVGCDYGKPVTIRTGTGETVVFDAYPSVREIIRGAEDWELRPLSLVITSYSIHYTKLYELRISASERLQRKASLKRT